MAATSFTPVWSSLKGSAEVERRSRFLRAEVALIAVAVLLPIPALAATGASLPLPSIVQRVATSLVPDGVLSSEPTTLTRASDGARTVTITLTAEDRRRADRRASSLSQRTSSSAPQPISVKAAAPATAGDRARAAFLPAPVPPVTPTMTLAPSAGTIPIPSKPSASVRPTVTGGRAVLAPSPAEPEPLVALPAAAIAPVHEEPRLDGETVNSPPAARTKLSIDDKTGEAIVSTTATTPAITTDSTTTTQTKENGQGNATGEVRVDGQTTTDGNGKNDQPSKNGDTTVEATVPIATETTPVEVAISTSVELAAPELPANGNALGLLKKTR